MPDFDKINSALKKAKEGANRQDLERAAAINASEVGNEAAQNIYGFEKNYGDLSQFDDKQLQTIKADENQRKEDYFKNTNAIERLSDGVEAGWDQLRGGTAYALGEVAGGDNKLSDWGENVLQNAPQGFGTMYEMGSFVPQAAGIAAATLAAPMTQGGSLAALPSILGTTNAAVLGASAVGGTLYDYDKYHRESGNEVNEVERWGAALSSGIAEFAFEKVGFGKYLPKGTGMGGRLFARAVKETDIPERLMRQFAKEQPSLMANFMKNTTANMFQEGMEESATELVNIGWELVYQNKEDYGDFWEYINRVGHAFKGGAMMAGMLGPISTASDHWYQEKRRDNQQKDKGFGVWLGQDKQGHVFEILGVDEAGNVSGLTADGKEVKTTRNDIDDDIRLTKEEFDEYYKAIKTGDGVREFEQDFIEQKADQLVNKQTGNIEVYRPAHIEEDEPGGYYLLNKGADGMAMVRDVLTDKVKMIPFNQLNLKEGEVLSKEQYIKNGLERLRGANQEQGPRFEAGQTVVVGGQTGVVTEVGTDGSMVVENDKEAFTVPVDQLGNVKEAIPFTDGNNDFVGIENEDGTITVGEPIVQEEQALQMAEQLNKAYEGKKSFVIIPNVDEDDPNIPNTYSIVAKPYEVQPQTGQEAQAQESDQAPPQQPEQVEPTYTKDKQPVSRAYIKRRLMMAESMDELKGIEFAGDAELDAMLQEKFPPPPTPVYTLDGEEISREEVAELIAMAKTPEHLDGLIVENDNELKALYAAKFGLDELRPSLDENTIQNTDSEGLDESSLDEKIEEKTLLGENTGQIKTGTIDAVNQKEIEDIQARLADPNEPADQKEYWKDDLKDLQENPGKYWGAFAMDLAEGEREAEILAMQEHYKVGKYAEQPEKTNPIEHAGTFVENVVQNKEIAQAEEEVNQEPTEGQKEAGNYKKGHVKVQGLDITIENPKGSTRKGTDPNGNEWENTINHTYGYFKRTEGKDGDQVDVFIGDTPTSDKVFIIDQIDPETGKFDEHKVLLGFNSAEEAQAAYLSNYEDGWQGIGAINERNIDQFKKWLKNGKKKNRALSYKQAKKPNLINQVLQHDPVSVEHLIIQYFLAGGRVSSDWVKREVTSRSEAERKQRIGLIKKDGPVHDQLHEMLIQGTAFESFPEDEFRNILIEVIHTLPNKSLMVQRGMDLIGGMNEDTQDEYGKDALAFEEQEEYERLEELFNRSISQDEISSAIENEAVYLDYLNDTYGTREANNTGSDQGNSGEIAQGTGDTEIIPNADGDRPTKPVEGAEQPPIATGGTGSSTEGGNKGTSRLVSDQRAEELRKKLRDKLNNLNAGLDPEMMMIGAELAVYHIESGAIKFADFSKKMIADFGDKVVPYLKSFYLSAKNFPNFNNEGMDKASFVEDYDVNSLLAEEKPESTSDNIDVSPLMEKMDYEIVVKGTEHLVSHFGTKDEPFIMLVGAQRIPPSKKAEPEYLYRVISRVEGIIPSRDWGILSLKNNEYNQISEELERKIKEGANETKPIQNEKPQSDKEPGTDKKGTKPDQETKTDFADHPQVKELLEEISQKEKALKKKRNELTVKSQGDLFAGEFFTGLNTKPDISKENMERIIKPMEAEIERLKTQLDALIQSLETGVKENEGQQSLFNDLDQALSDETKIDNLAQNQNNVSESETQGKRGTQDEETGTTQEKSSTGLSSLQESIRDAQVREEESGSDKKPSRDEQIALFFGGLGQSDNGSVQSARPSRVEQEEQLIKFAKDNDLLLSEEDISNLTSRKLPEGKEASVFLDNDGERVIKVVNYTKYSNTPLDFYNDRVELFNNLFGETAYSILGFKEAENGTQFVLSQPFIKGKLLSQLAFSVEGLQDQQSRIEGFMKERFGMSNAGLDAFANEQHKVQDLHLKNVMEGIDGNLYVIDAIPGTLKIEENQEDNDNQHDKEPEHWTLTKAQYKGIIGRELTEKEIDEITDIDRLDNIIRMGKHNGKNVILTQGKWRYQPTVSQILAHKKSVSDAISQGEEIPSEVLKDYPDLEKQVNQSNEKYQDFGEKIGGARKDLEAGTGKKKTTKKESSPVWMKGYEIIEAEDGTFLPIKAKGRFITWKSRVAYPTKEDAERVIMAREVAQKFRPFQNQDDTYSIFRIVTDRKRHEYKSGFNSRDEAMQYMAENLDELINFKPQFPDRPHLEVIERTGKDYRNNKDITPKDFQDAFGFRGGEFGNWLAGDERQKVLNMAYDALMDMAEVLGLPPQGISLGGELSIAFGARGHGLTGASAHYERDRAVFNLTRMNGAGSVAHEWFHALDHYFGNQDRKKTYERNENGVIKAASSRGKDYLSQGTAYDSGMRKELRDLYIKMIKGLYRKDGVVEVDHARHDKALERASSRIEEAINRVVTDMKEKKTYGKKTDPATDEQLSRFENLAERARKGDQGKETWISTSKRDGYYITELIQEMSDLYKEVRGRGGFTKNGGILAELKQAIGYYNSVKSTIEKYDGVETETKSVSTDYFSDSKEVDHMRVSDYYTTEHEMAARAFESFVHDKIREKGDKSDYLVHSTDGAMYRLLYGVNPYPEGSERKAFGKMMEDFFAEVKTKQVDGKTILFKKAFHSPSEQAALMLKQEKGTPDQMKAMLLKGGAKQAELDWMGWDDFASGKDKVTKAEISDWMRDNRVELEEVVKERKMDKPVRQFQKGDLILQKENEEYYKLVDDTGRVYADAAGYEVETAEDIEQYLIDRANRYEQAASERAAKDDTKYKQYATPGGYNYKEWLLTLPKQTMQYEYKAHEIGGTGRFIVVNETTGETVKNGGFVLQFDDKENAEVYARQRSKNLVDTDDNYKSGHWDESNIAVHARTKEFVDDEGKRVLFIEEIQSDWAQEGRKKGFNIPTKKYTLDNTLLKRKDDLLVLVDSETHEELADRFEYNYENSGLTKDQVKQDLLERYNNSAERQNSTIPNMPFKNTDQWTGLALKRLMRYAAENGFDRIAWTTGEQQAERYDLSKQIKSVSYSKDGYLSAFDHDGNRVIDRAASEKQLPDIIGKEAADKLVQQEPDGLGNRAIHDQDLKIGGEGMKGYYDNMVPKVMKKLYGKFGAKQQLTTLMGDIQVHSVDITPQMQEVGRGSQAMFKRNWQLSGASNSNTAGEAIAKYMDYWGNEAKREAIEKEVAAFEDEYNVPVKVIPTVHLLPMHLSMSIPIEDHNRIKGVYYNGQVYLIASNLSKGDVKAVYLHEVLAHKGLRDMLGDQHKEVLRMVYDNMSETDRKNFAYLYDTQDEMEIADEYLAHIAESYKRPALLEKVVAKIRELLRKVFNIDYSVNDVMYLLHKAENYYKFEPKPVAKDFKELGDYVDALRAWRGDLRFKKDPKHPADLSKKGDKFIEGVQDRMLKVKRLQDEVVKRGGKMDDYSNAYEQENRSYGTIKSETERVGKDLADPLVGIAGAIIKKKGFDIDAFQKYLKAKHAPERNEWFAEQTGKDNNSGMTNAQAEAIVKKYEEGLSSKEISKLWDSVNKLTGYTLKRWLNDGFITQETYDSLNARWKYYVPLRGFKDAGTELFEYQHNAIGKRLNPNRKAEGRESESDDPIQYMINMAHTAIVLGENNRVKQYMFRMIKNNKMDDLFSAEKVYYIDTGAIDKNGHPIVQETIERPSQELFDQGKVKLSYNRDHYKNKPAELAKQHEIDVYVDGRKYVLHFENPGVAQAMNKDNNDHVPEWISNTIGKWTRWLTSNFTAKNPAFIPINAMRDIGYSVLAHAIKGNPGDAIAFMKHLKSAQQGMKDYQNGKGGKLVDLYKDFMANGGETGFIHLKDVDTIKREFEKEIKRYLGTNSTWDKVAHHKALKYLGERMENWAIRSENISRFATYMVAIENGKTPKKAAYEAKEISVNFNRRGMYSSWLGSFYAFFNASLQGGENFIRMGWQNKKGFAMAGAGFFAAGFLNAMFNWDDDEEDKNHYKHLSGYMKKNYLCVPYGDNKYLSIPLPHGFRGFYGMGVSAFENMFKESESSFAMDVADALFSSISPVNPTELVKDGKLSSRAIIPTVAIPIYDLTQNEDFAGRPIGRQPYTKEQEEREADAGLGRANVNVLVKWLTDKLYEMGGGDVDIYKKTVLKDGEKHKVSELFDWNPSNVEHVLSYYLGGRGKFWNDVFKTVVGGAAQVVKDEPEAFDWNDVPILARLNRTAYGRNLWSEYYKAKDDVEVYFETMKKYPEWEQGMNFNPEYAVKKELIDELDKELKSVSVDDNELKIIANPQLLKALREQRELILEQYMNLINYYHD